MLFYDQEQFFLLFYYIYIWPSASEIALIYSAQFLVNDGGMG